MKTKIIGIIVCMLLITTVLPATGVFLEIHQNTCIKEKMPHSTIPNELNNEESKLKMMIAGKGLRCLRSYRIYVPSGYDGTEPVPLVIACHGSTGMGPEFKPLIIYYFYQDTWFETYTDLNEKAEEENFIVVYPKGLVIYSSTEDYYLFAYNALQYPDTWIRWRKLIDDVGFTNDLIEKMQTKYNIDPSRIYMTGFSAGADITYSCGCVLSDKIAAIASVAGNVACKEASAEDFIYPPNPEHPVSTIVFHGTNDPYIYYNGHSTYCSVNESVQFWVNNNDCDPIPEVNVSTSGIIERFTYSNGTDGSEVILYKTIGGGHWWPGTDFTDPNNTTPWLVDTIQEIDATDLIWEFFEQHPKQ